MSWGDAARFGEWASKPVVQDAVIAFLTGLEGGALAREVATGCNIPMRVANRALNRLAFKGFLTRYRIPVTGSHHVYRTRTNVPGGATFQMWLYSIAEDAE